MFIMDRLSFESGGESIGGIARIPDGGKAIPNRKTLPIAIRFGLLPLGIGYPPDCLIHEDTLSNEIP
ncbi:MAG: hypothetical protein ABSF53_04555 [Terracidiphilus sp.]